MHRTLVVLGLCGWSVGCAHTPAAQVAAPGAVRPGIDVLLTDSLAVVRDRRVGLVTNQAGVDAQGISDVTRLRAAGVRLVALFSPEHGFRGAADPGAAVASSIDSATGLPIYSLYGRSTAPTDSMLAGLDLLLVDLQDAGARYYTYLFTTIEVMRSAARNSIPVVVLDRPDPIGGAVQGNVLDSAYRTPVGQLAVPMRYGMTLGELARLARADLGLTTDLRVVPVAGWRRGMAFDADRTSVRPAEPEPPFARGALPLSGHLPVRGHQPERRSRHGRRLPPDRGAVARHRRPCSLGCGRHVFPGSDSRPCRSLRARRATGNTRTRRWPAFGSR